MRAVDEVARKYRKKSRRFQEDQGAQRVTVKTEKEKEWQGHSGEQYCGMRGGRRLMRVHSVTDKWIS